MYCKNQPQHAPTPHKLFILQCSGCTCPQHVNRSLSQGVVQQGKRNFCKQGALRSKRRKERGARSQSQKARSLYTFAGCLRPPFHTGAADACASGCPHVPCLHPPARLGTSRYQICGPCGDGAEKDGERTEGVGTGKPSSTALSPEGEPARLTHGRLDIDAVFHLGNPVGRQRLQLAARLGHLKHMRPEQSERQRPGQSESQRPGQSEPQRPGRPQTGDVSPRNLHPSLSRAGGRRAETRRGQSARATTRIRLDALQKGKKKWKKKKKKKARIQVKTTRERGEGRVHRQRRRGFRRSARPSAHT